MKVNLGQQSDEIERGVQYDLNSPVAGQYRWVEHLQGKNKREGRPGEIPKLGRAFYLCVLAVLALAVAPAHAEQRGKVYLVVNPQAPIQEWQVRPLSGAFVVLEWTVTIPGPGHAGSSCRYSELARTDDTGEYVIEGPNPITATLARTSYYVYSPGLEEVAFRFAGSAAAPKDITMSFSPKTPEDRLSQLSFLTRPGCSDTKVSDPRALFVPYLRALLDEAKTLNVDSPRGRQDVAHIEVELRRATVGDPPPQGPRVVRVPAGVEANKVPPPDPRR